MLKIKALRRERYELSIAAENKALKKGVSIKQNEYSNKFPIAIYTYESYYLNNYSLTTTSSFTPCAIKAS